jgi:cytidylate kinase
MSTIKTKLTPILESNFKFQVKNLDRGNSGKPLTETRHPSLTISREFGCEGYPLAHKMAEYLNKPQSEWHIYNRDIFDEISESSHYTEKLLEEMRLERRNQLQQYLDQLFSHTPTELVRFKKLAQNIRAVTHKGNAIVVGSGGAILGHDDPHQFHVRLVASLDFKIARLRPLVPDMSVSEVIETIESTNRNRVDFIREFTSKDITEPFYYDLILNNDRFTVDQMAQVVIQAMITRGLISI